MSGELLINHFRIFPIQRESQGWFTTPLREKMTRFKKFFLKIVNRDAYEKIGSQRSSF